MQLADIKRLVQQCLIVDKKFRSLRQFELFLEPLFRRRDDKNMRRVVGSFFLDLFPRCFDLVIAVKEHTDRGAFVRSWFL